MTDKEMKTKIDDLSTWEEELNKHEREILERERAVMLAEQNIAKRPDVEQTDYLFDRINADNRKMVLSVPPVIQISPPSVQHTDMLTTIMAALAAVASTLTLVLTALR